MLLRLHIKSITSDYFYIYCGWLPIYCLPTLLFLLSMILKSNSVFEFSNVNVLILDNELRMTLIYVYNIKSVRISVFIMILHSLKFYSHLSPRYDKSGSKEYIDISILF